MRLDSPKLVTGTKFVVGFVVIFLLSLPFFFLAISWRLISLLFPPHIYHIIDDFIFGTYQRFTLFFAEILAGTKIILYGDVKSVLKKERVIFMSNHQGTVDWMISNLLASRQCSVGHVRYVMKKSLLYLLPLYGLYDYFHGCIFVKRENFDPNKFVSSLSYLGNKKIPSWIILFPEGTRYNPEEIGKIEKSKKYAEDQGLRPFQHVLFPKHKGLHLLLKGLKDNLDAVYDVTIIYSCTKGKGKEIRTRAPTLLELLANGCEAVHIHVNRIGIDKIPETEDGLKKLLYDLFREKDKILESYYNKTASADSCLASGTKSPPNFIYTIASFMFALLLFVPFIIIPSGISLYFLCCIYVLSANYLYLLVFSLFLDT